MSAPYKTKRGRVLRTKVRKHLMVLVLALLASTVQTTSVAQSPQFQNLGHVSYRGRITSNETGRIPNNADLTFRLYTAAIQGTLIWGETHNSVNIDVAMGGTFFVQLGAGTPLANMSSFGQTPPAPAVPSPSSLAEVLDGAQLFLEVQVDNDKPLFPRQQLLYTPYAVFALSAARAETADTFAGSVAGGSYPPGVVVPFAGVITGGIPPGWLLCNGQELTESANQALFNVIGNTYNLGSTPAGKFLVPDYRGYFHRGAVGGMNTAGVRQRRTGPFTDELVRRGPFFPVPDDYIGSWQPDDVQSHDHRNGSNNRLLKSDGKGTVGGPEDDDTLPGHVNLLSSAGLTAGNNGTSVETIPDNAAVYFLIKK